MNEQVRLPSPPISPVAQTEMFASILDSLPDAVLLLDSEWKITYANRLARRISRIAEEHLNSHTLWELFPEIVGTELERAYRDAVEFRIEQKVSRFYYQPFNTWFDIHILPREGGITVHYRDVTLERNAQAERDTAAQQLQRVFDLTTDAIVSLDREWRFTFINRTASRLLEKHHELIGKTLWEEFPDTIYDDSPYVHHYRRAMDEAIAGSFVAYYPEPLNSWLHVMAYPTENGITVFFRDITEHREREDAIRESEQRYRVLAELSPQSLWTADAQGRVLYANQRFLEYIGKDFVPRDGTEYLRCFYEEDRERVLRVWSQSVATGNEYVIDARLVRASDGAVRWWHLRALPMRDEEGKIMQWLGVANDVHETHVAAQRLRDQYAEIDHGRREMEAIYRGAPIGMALYEPTNLRLLRLNDRQAEILGLKPEEALGRRFDQLIPEIARSHELIRRAAQGEPMLNQYVEGTLPTRPGEYRYWNVNYSPIFDENGAVKAVAGATIEITQQKLAEKALMQSEKLAAVGRLASSIAHEINNPLEAVTNLLYISRQISEFETIHTYLELADEELRRVANIVNQTLRFHKQVSRPQAVNCIDLFNTVLNMYQSRLRNSNITVERRKRAEKPVEVYEGDIRQVLNNIVGNAIDAMPCGGRLLVRTRAATDWRTGRKGVALTLADTGCGIHPRARARIFEPFFTTKENSGTGLGLWISAEIMERHGGRIRIRSTQRPGRSGTVVQLFLPYEGSKAPVSELLTPLEQIPVAS